MRRMNWLGRWRAPAVFTCVVLCAGSCEDPTNGGDGTSSRILWRVPLPVATASDPAVNGQELYFVSGGVVALRGMTGEQVWYTRPVGRVYTPRNVVVSGGRVFEAESLAFAFDQATGRELWRFTPVTNASLGVGAADAYAFYFGTGTTARRVYALDPASGRELWSTEIGPDWPFQGWIGGIAVSGDTVYVAAQQHRAANGYKGSGWLIALDRRTGRSLWHYVSGEGEEKRGFLAEPTVAGRWLLVIDAYGNSVTALDRFTGQEVWRFAGERNYLGPVEAPAVVGNRVYFASGDTHVYALELETGQKVWQAPIGASVHALVVCGQEVFAQSQRVTILDRVTGQRRTVLFEDGSDFAGSRFAVGQDRVFVIGTEHVYALGCR